MGALATELAHDNGPQWEALRKLFPPIETDAERQFQAAVAELNAITLPDLLSDDSEGVLKIYSTPRRDPR